MNNLHRRALPLIVRIVVGYTLAATVILSISAVFLYRGLEQGFVVEDTELLSDQIEQVRGLVGKGHPEEVRQFILGAAGVRNLEKYYGRLLDESGRVVVETPGIERVAPAAAEFSAPVNFGQQVESVSYWHGPKERFALLASAEIRHPDNASPWIFQIALDAEHVAEWLDEYRTRLYWMVGGGTLITALLGWFITRRGLRPLRQITAKIKDVTAHETTDRLDARDWPHELAELAGEFDDMLGRLRGSFGRLAQFSADVAHEFRTPLNNLLGATSLTLSRSRGADDYRTALEGNLEQFERLGKMVQSLLFIARAENEEAVLNKHPCHVGTIVGEVCDFFSALAEERKILLTCDGNAVVSADEILLRLAVSNLVSNAIRHTPSGGSIAVHVSCDEAGRCEISVTDTGCGIPEEIHARLFERFFRADTARAGADGGTGLGLAIVKSVMTLHGGTVSIESTPAKGAKFRLTFPSGSRA